MNDQPSQPPTAKTDRLQARESTPLEDKTTEHLTTNQGVRIADNQNSLRAGERGPTLMEDFIFREKMTHFDHERIPERVVHARGSAAHGFFQAYDDSMKEYTKAAFLTDASRQTPVFVRFSTVAGFSGSSDTVRDARGFATKFYTEEGNFDLVGNNIPVFFIQDAIKFPDLVHAVKPEPHHGMPQASAAHDNFWDFISLTPESMHMVMWVLSDRALPRSYRMMDGFGVHTFRFVNAEGKSTFVKFHWRPVLGTHSLAFDEAQKIAGKDPDFNRRDLWDAIEAGNYPEYELGVQLVPEEDEHKFDFDLLDATKIIPEEEVPLRMIGKLTLTRNPENFFAETEQVAFHPGHIVPGIDFSNDPLLQGRLFSYLDTQLIRLGGPNFTEIPINRPLAPVRNNQRDGFMRQTVNRGRVNYEPNSLARGCPMHDPNALRAFASYGEKIEGRKVRARSESFGDHFSQATLFWNSLSEPEKKHLVSAIHFELGKVEHMHIRERMIRLFANVDRELAERAARGIGVKDVSTDLAYLNESSAPKPNAKRGPGRTARSAALSLANTKFSAKTRKVAILAAPGVDGAQVAAINNALKAAGVTAHVVAEVLGPLPAGGGGTVEADKSFLTSGSVTFDAVLIPGGAEGVKALQQQGNARHFVQEAFKHCKPIAALGDGVMLLESAEFRGVRLSTDAAVGNDKGVVTAGAGADRKAFVDEFVRAIAKHRYWERESESVAA
jgi:catalase